VSSIVQVSDCKLRSFETNYVGRINCTFVSLCLSAEGIIAKNYIKLSYSVLVWEFPLNSALSVLIKILIMKINDTLLMFLKVRSLCFLSYDTLMASDNIQCCAVGDCLTENTLAMLVI
jgi:hypothetical protein